MTIDSAGNVGIGTEAPSHLLDVEGVAHAATCVTSPTVCAPTLVDSGTICSTGLICAATCVLAQQCVCTSLVRAICCVTVGSCVCAGNAVYSACICATSRIHSTSTTASCFTCLYVSGGAAPSGNNDAVPKCYVDNQVAAAGANVCRCEAKACITLNGCDIATGLCDAAAKGFVYVSSNTYSAGASANCFGRFFNLVFIYCGGCCVGLCRRDGNDNLCISSDILAHY